ncbi:MAG TPA: hypothetical protein VJ111_14050 [Chitinophagaceae bacterium]|nr:hypothetical protein [Chitinophagaceae bacterium]
MPRKKINQPPRVNTEKEPDKNKKKHVSEAHDQAEKDIEKDPDLNLKPRKENDMDEGELARLEGED